MQTQDYSRKENPAGKYSILKKAGYLINNIYHEIRFQITGRDEHTINLENSELVKKIDIRIGREL